MTNRFAPRDIALTAVMIALVAVVTRFLIVPVGAGYFNFADMAIYFVAFTFGPWIGLLAGGIGAALADLSVGYAAFAPLTMLAHGLQGFVAGGLARRLPGDSPRPRLSRSRIAQPHHHARKLRLPPLPALS